MEAFAEAVGLRRPDVGSAMLDLAHGQEELEGVVERATAVLAPVVGEQVVHVHPVLLAERQHAFVEHVHRRLRHPRQVQFRAPAAN
jgi:hypothetical protein